MNILQIRLRGVSGFYSEWSPSIRTNNVKVLTASKEQVIITEGSCEITPPRLGDVDEFDMTVIQCHKLNSKQDQKNFNIDKPFKEPNDYEEDSIDEKQEPPVNGGPKPRIYGAGLN